YAPQLFHLIRTLGLNLIYALSVQVGVMLSLFVLIRWMYRADWISRVPRRLSPAMIPILVVAGLGFSSVRLYAYSAFPSVGIGEPVSLTLLPEQGTHRLQGAT